MSTPKSHDRAAELLHATVKACPGIDRTSLLKKISKEANCHSSTVQRAIGEALDLGIMVVRRDKQGAHYNWNDSPMPTARDTHPQIIRRVPANELPKIVGVKCPNAIAWGVRNVLEGNLS